MSLDRFVDAQAGIYAAVTEELRRGAKRGHWMWYIFPQIVGLGQTPTSRLYAISSIDEAREYLAHPLLGPRQRECTSLAISANRSAEQIFPAPDHLKFRSCMTLFAVADPAEPLFGAGIDRLCGGVRDPATLRILGALATHI